MKFTLASISTALMSVSIVSGAAIIQRDAASDQNETMSQFPNTTDIGSLNGTCKYNIICDKIGKIKY
jgi:hypothetical protein